MSNPLVEPSARGRCTRCILLKNHPGLTFDSAGVCSNCTLYDKQKPQPKGEEALRRDVEPYRNSGRKWDCAFALSGGRDSTYSLYYAVKHLKLKPIAFTIDQGFIPDETWENMANATRILSVEHVVVKHQIMQKSIRPMLKTWLKHPSPGMVTFMCLGCRLGLYRGLRKLSYHYDLPICLTGNGEPQEKDFAKALYTTAENPKSAMIGLAKGIGKDLLRNPRYFLRPSLIVKMFLEGVYIRPPAAFVKKFTGLRWKNIDVFRYLPYEEARIEKVLREELGWKRFHHASAGWRSDCKIPLLKNAMYLKLLGFTRHDGLLSGMVRRGLMTRDEALARLPVDNQIPETFLKEFFEELGLEYETTWLKTDWDRFAQQLSSPAR